MDEGVELAVLALLDGVDQVLGLLLPEALQPAQLRLRQGVQLVGLLQKPRLHQLGGGLFGEGVDVHGVPAGEVAQPHDDLGLAAVAVGTEQVRPALLERRPAGGTDLGPDDVALALLVLVHPAHDLRDDLVGAPYPHLRPQLHPLALDVLPVVQRGLPHRGPRQLHRRDPRHRGQLARAPDLPGHVLQGGGLLLRLELVRHRPARELVGVAQGVPRGVVVDLDHRAVDHVVQPRPVLLDAVHRGHGLRQRPGVDLAGRGGEAVLPQEGQHLVLGGEGLSLDVAHVVEAGVQPAGRGHRRVEVPQRARRGVPGVLQRLFGRLVVLVQHGDAHEALPVDLHAALEGDGQRNGADGHHLGEDLLAHDAVAPGGRADEPPVLVGQVHRQSVELVLHHVGDGRQRRAPGVGVLPQLLRPPRPVLQRLDGLRLAHRPQPRDVGVGLEARQDRAAHPPGRGVRQALARLRLQPNQLVVQRVPLRVRDRGVIQRVVLIGRLVQTRH